jgi:hypothetical protein
MFRMFSTPGGGRATDAIQRKPSMKKCWRCPLQVFKTSIAALSKVSEVRIRICLPLQFARAFFRFEQKRFIGLRDSAQAGRTVGFRER